MNDMKAYEALCRGFRWNIPERYNIAADVCDRHATDPNRIALVSVGERGDTRNITFLQVQRLASKMANLFAALGLARGERVMLLLGQSPWTAISHVACWKAGLVSTPTSPLFGPDAIAYRLGLAGVRVAITDLASLPSLLQAASEAPVLQHIFLIDGDEAGAPSLERMLETASDNFTNVDTGANEPAFLNFTSGTTGFPKGALQAHRSMLGHIPGVQFGFDAFPQPGDLMWSPADWSWLAGLMDVLMPAWFFGQPVLTFRAQKFDPEQAFRMIGEHGVRTALLTPTMLRLMRQVPDPVQRYGARLRAVISGGESVGKELHEWSRHTLGLPVNEMFGQTECNLVIGNNSRLLPLRPGSLGRPVPGHTAAIVDDKGQQLPVGTIGNLAFRAPDPVMMLEYWRNPEATAEKYANGWLLSGDLAQVDDEGFFWFEGRADDVITSSGYRIGPTEIEDTLIKHPAVVMAAVIGIADPVRTEAIRAYVVLNDRFKPSETLALEIRNFVRSKLARHETPHEVVFSDALPLTVTGKILRRALREAASEQSSAR
ncbi:AMP-dependent synthetase [Camelimonas fluminis]|uniref:AMP-binding protein n=1 Tax=Camelimonas fluminis TaxID=1576911 RepID=A0ABV7UG75_9HYPH|nr:AMP-binding protein [Camelimonas fluminis]GHE78456.1 AMP-dependent synthetase [Camelimonas fluminis]